jgi:hypothetical protein
MKSTIRRLGSVAVVLAALAAFPAMALATEAGFESEIQHTYLSGGHRLLLTAGIAQEECLSKNETSLMEERQVASISLTESYLCGPKQESELKMNGCAFQMYPGTDSFAVGPSGCGPIDAPLDRGLCRVSIGAQTAGFPATFSNQGSGTTRSVNIGMNSGSKVKYTVTQGNECGEKGKTFENLSIESIGTWTEIGREGPSEAYPQVGILARYLASDGLFMKSAGSEASLNAQIYSATVTTSPTGKSTMVFKGGTKNAEAVCKTAQFASTTLGGPVHGEELTPTYGQCTFTSLGATVSMNSCHYSLTEFKGLAAFRGKGSVSCTKEGDAIEVRYNSFECTVKIPPQSLGESLTLTNEGSGSTEKVNAHLSASGVQYTDIGSVCGSIGLPKSPGSGTDGSIDLNVTLAGSRITE